MDISSLVNAAPPPPPSEPNPDATTDRPSSTQSALFDAIDSATLDRVRTVLRDVCTHNSDAFALASAKLLVRNPTDTKRKRDVQQQRYEICAQCKEEYDVLDNDEGACEWHPGETEPDFDGDFWADHDENCHGTINSEELRSMYPEGYRWSCCDKLSDEEGCKLGVHVPDAKKRKMSSV